MDHNQQRTKRPLIRIQSSFGLLKRWLRRWLRFVSRDMIVDDFSSGSGGGGGD
ncbi:MAG: hypothetical protein IPJ94_27710 [Chloroflexi bacterium]|nr:hypothetical protein [Chloroflexota bacterium]